MPIKDHIIKMIDRREFLSTVPISLGLSGCLQLTKSPDKTGTGTSTKRVVTETDTEDNSSPKSQSSKEESTETSGPPPGTNWIVSAQAPFVAAPTVVEEKVIATSQDRHIYAIDTESGEVQWTASSEGELDSLAVAGGVTVAADLKEQLGVTVEGGTVTYRKRQGFEAGVRKQATAGGTVFQCLPKGGIRSLDPTTGTEQWTTESTKSMVDIDYDDETICVGIQPTGHFGSPPWAFAGFDSTSGEKLWYVERDSDEDGGEPKIVVSNGACLAYSGGDHYMTIDARSGEVYTENQASDFLELHPGTDGIALTQDRDGFYGVNTQTGETQWETKVRTDLLGPTFFDGTVFWHLQGNTLNRLDPKTGENTEEGELTLGNAQIDGGFAVGNETVFMTMSDATLRAVERP